MYIVLSPPAPPPCVADCVACRVQHMLQPTSGTMGTLRIVHRAGRGPPQCRYPLGPSANYNDARLFNILSDHCM